MRLWRKEQAQSRPATRRDYETVGYVIDGRDELRAIVSPQRPYARNQATGSAPWCAEREHARYYTSDSAALPQRLM